MSYEWAMAGQGIGETLDLGYIGVAGLHRGSNSAVTVVFNPPNFGPHTMTH